MLKIIALMALALTLGAQTENKTAGDGGPQMSPTTATSSNSAANGSSGSTSHGAISGNGGNVVSVIGDGRFRVRHVAHGDIYLSIPVDEEYAKMLLRVGCDVGEEISELYKKNRVRGKETWVRVPISCRELQKMKK